VDYLRTPIVLLVLLLGLLATVVAWDRPAPLFTPDTRYYASMAFHTAGESKDEARDRVAAHTEKLGYPTPATDVVFSWGLVGPRIVYPTLSAPFVKVMGFRGLAVIPAIAYVLGLLVMLRVLLRRVPPAVALLPVLLYLASMRLAVYGTSMLTESLSLLLVAGMALLLPWEERMSRGRLLGLFLLMTTLAFTRQATLIPAGAIVVAWFGSSLRVGRARTPWLAPAAVALGSAVGWQVVQAIAWPGLTVVDDWERKTGTSSVWGALLASPRLLRHIIATDVTDMARNDVPLLLLLTLAVVACVVCFRRTEGQLLIGGLLGTLVYQVLNGTPTSFRYGEPGMVFVLLGVAALLSRVVAGSARALPDVEDEQPEVHAGERGRHRQQEGARFGSAQGPHDRPRPQRRPEPA
jgi:hypothetical protein